jgi:hypothetical protein
VSLLWNTWCEEERHERERDQNGASYQWSDS